MIRALHSRRLLGPPKTNNNGPSQYDSLDLEQTEGSGNAKHHRHARSIVIRSGKNNISVNTIVIGMSGKHHGARIDISALQKTDNIPRICRVSASGRKKYLAHEKFLKRD